MAAGEDIVLDNTVTYDSYLQPQLPVFDVTQGTGTAVTSINGLTGPSVSFSGGTTGLSFSPAAPNITLGGTLVAANGGTGQTTYTKGDLLAASAATTLSILNAAANDARLTTDSTQSTGLKWIAASTGWGAASGTLSRAAYAAYAGQTVSNPPTQAQVQAIDDALKLLSQTVAALLTDLASQKIIKA